MDQRGLSEMRVGVQAAAKKLLCQIPYAEMRQEAERRRDQFSRWCAQRGYADAVQCLETVGIGW